MDKLGKFKAIVQSILQKGGLTNGFRASSNGQEPDNELTGKQLRFRQYKYLAALFLVIVVGIFAVLRLNMSKTAKRPAVPTAIENKATYKLELATGSVKAAEKWQSFLEDSIEDEKNTRSEQLKLLEESISKSGEQLQVSQSKELEEIRERLSYTLAELTRLKAENIQIKDEVAMLNSNNGETILPIELGLTTIGDEKALTRPVSSWNHIPATSYASGHLLGGIAVSTSVSSASEPVPVVIRLTDRGNLPKSFAVDIKQCRLLASCYGDISSERAIIRAEELVCENKKDGFVTITKVAGVIYGDDGMNGIRGSVVSMSDKHLKNAFIGGVLSGFSNTAKGENGLNVTPLGMLATKKKGIGDMAQDGLLSGASTASEKLADYHIKLAENISPVILIPGGTKVDVLFTRSVLIGSDNVREKISETRDKKK